ncbi:MAG: peroxidase-related enzyme, partial [Acidimicrobiia bacterium]|nr:peroxidase-related enzyme [Acidimicrobiia bacterium]
MTAISRFPIGDLADLPSDIRERIEPIAERSGFVPNIFVGLIHRPAELRAFLDFHDALMERDSGLSKAEREMIVVATSAANDCLYCVVAHGAILRVRAKDAQISDR